MADGRVSQVVVETLSAPAASAGRVTQAALETLSAPAAAARVTQVVIETLGTPNAVFVATPGRVTQLTVETLQSVPPSPIRATQVALELFAQRPAATGATQVVVELFVPVSAGLRTTQAAVELWDGRHAQTRVTQVLVELWARPLPCRDIYPLLPVCGVDGFPVLPDVGLDVYPVLPAEGEDRYPVAPAATPDLYPLLPEGYCMDASTFVANMALAEIGITKTIANLAADATQEATLARLVFSDVMDTVLRDFPWKFATEYAALAWIAGTPALPVNPDWTYSYLLPVDCVRVRRVCDPTQQRRYVTTPVPFDQRASGDGSRDVLLCNEPGAGLLAMPTPGDPVTLTIEYTKRLACPAQVNDAQFREAVVYKLAARLAKGLARDSKDADRCLRNYTMALPKAQTQHANDAEPQRPVGDVPDWTKGR